MASSRARRFLLSAMILVFLYYKILCHNAKPRESSNFPESRERLHASLSCPFANESDYIHFVVDSSSKCPSNARAVIAGHSLSHPGAGALEATELLVLPQRSKIALPAAFRGLSKCSRLPNRFTHHIRLSNLLYNISMILKYAVYREERTFWNPSISALPYWAKNQYIIVSMVAPNGEALRRNVLCEANICHHNGDSSHPIYERLCTDDDLALLGANGGLRCATTPIDVSLPSTPATKCEGSEQTFADIPSFHDLRLFYSGKEELILMVSSQSQYACIGVWAIDLREVYTSITEILASSPRRLGSGPLTSYPTLTELTRNPPSSRRSYEINWIMFSPSTSTSYLQYELSSHAR